MILTAHSGSDYTLENSLEFIDACLINHVDCLEVDVQKDAHGVLYLSHDSLGESEPRVTLSEALHRIQESSIYINCDLKVKDCERAVIELLKQFGLEHRYYLSGDVNLYHVPKDQREHVMFNIENYFTSTIDSQDIKEDQLESFCLFLKLNQVRIVNMHYSVWSKPLEHYLSQYQLQCSLWTIETYEMFMEYKDKVSYITSRCAFACMKEVQRVKVAQS